MATALLLLIYLAFISLGIPDSLFGAAWPAMGEELGTVLSAGGLVTSLISGATIVSSLCSGKILGRFGTGAVTMVSVALTALSLLGFSLAPGFLWLCLLAVPLGLGAGCVDSGLNNYVALHYSANQMNLLHGFYGIGVSLSPYLMSLALEWGSWRQGYGIMAALQGAIGLLLLVTLPLWKRVGQDAGAQEAETKPVPVSRLFRMPGFIAGLLAFAGSCGLEYTAGIWGSTYLVAGRGCSPEAGARGITLYYIGMTAGRMLSGFLAGRLGSRRLVRWGQGLAGLGAAFLLLPLPGWAAVVGLFWIGFGNGPVFPNLLHLTPRHFGRAASQSAMGVQMASSYLAITLLPPLGGLLIQSLGSWALPGYLLSLFGLMGLCTGVVFAPAHGCDTGAEME